MKPIFSFFCRKWMGYLFLVVFCSCSKNQNDEIRIGLQPTDGEHDTKDLAGDLSTRMNAKVRFVVSKDYQNLVDLFKSKKIDFAFFTALNFVQAEREAGAKVLLKKVYGEDEFYYSAIVVRKDSKINHSKDLRAKKFGFVDPSSTSGYLYPRMILKQEGFDSGIGAAGENILPYEFFGTHEKALTALTEGKIDAVGVWANDPKKKSGAWTNGKFAAPSGVNCKSESAKCPGSVFKVLVYSEPIPNDAFVVRADYFVDYPNKVFRMMEALIGAGEDPKNVLKKTLAVDKMATATSRHYDSVRGLENLLKGR